jgi:hypothetical protein
MNITKEEKRRILIKLQNFMEKSLPELDEITEGNHPIWGVAYSDCIAEILLQVILFGLLSDENFD